MLVGLIGIASMAVAVTVVVMLRQGGHLAAPASHVVMDARTPLSTLAKSVREGNAQALAALYERVMARPEGANEPKAVSDAEAENWVDALVGLRTGYLKFSPYGRATTMTVATRILDKFTVEPAPAIWVNTLAPTHDLLTAGMGDAALEVRTAAVNDVARLWIWSPGRSMLEIEEKTLATWKESFHAEVLRCLADAQPALRMSAVACLAALPLDSMAEPAVAYLADPNSDVRRQVLAAFAGRASLLSDEAILSRMGDTDPRVPPLAEQVLKTRGLNQDQIGLGALMYHPRPELRESVIPLVSNRTDIDPVIWLTQLSRDKDESVRMKAAEALAGRTSSEARLRLAEMAVNDPSPQVKKAAARLMTPTEETASLPPLPGSPSLTPKAN
jgi:HEAT repeat protein